MMLSSTSGWHVNTLRMDVPLYQSLQKDEYKMSVADNLVTLCIHARQLHEGMLHTLCQAADGTLVANDLI